MAFLLSIRSVYCCKTVVEVVILLTWIVPSLQLELAHFYNKHKAREMNYCTSVQTPVLSFCLRAPVSMLAL